VYYLVFASGNDYATEAHYQDPVQPAAAVSLPDKPGQDPGGEETGEENRGASGGLRVPVSGQTDHGQPHGDRQHRAD